MLIGGKRAQREATADHPFGYGRDRYIDAFIVSIVLFSLGGLFALYEGHHTLSEPGELVSPLIAVGVLVQAIVFESYALYTAVQESNKVRGDSSWVEFVRPVLALTGVGHRRRHRGDPGGAARRAAGGSRHPPAHDAPGARRAAGRREDRGLPRRHRTAVATGIDDAEQGIRAAVPIATHIHLEPAIDRSPTPSRGG